MKIDILNKFLNIFRVDLIFLHNWLNFISNKGVDL